MRYYMINQDLELVDGIELFESMIWTEKFYDVGDFELYLPATEESVKLYTEAAKQHYYIIRAEDTATPTNLSAMEIENVQLDTSVKDMNKLIITGRQLKNILRRRIIAVNTSVAGPIQNEIRRLVTENAIHPVESTRSIPRLELGPVVEGMDEIIINADGKGINLQTMITTLCKDRKVGWDIRIDFENQKLKFIMLNGMDRTQEVIFSPDYDNLLKTSYSVDTDNYRNIAYVDADYIKVDEITGKAETINNTQVVKLYGSSAEATGLDRYELYIDGSSEAGNTKDYTRSFQSNVLVTKGRTELEKYKSTTDVSGEVVPDLSFKLNIDYFLGDLVKIRNQFGIEYDGRVTSVTSSLSAKKNSVIPSFTIENYTGKEAEKDTSIKDEESRCSEDGTYRADEIGYVRRLSTGIEETGRITEDGYGRIDEDENNLIVSKNEYYDDEKYNA